MAQIDDHSSSHSGDMPVKNFLQIILRKLSDPDRTISFYDRKEKSFESEQQQAFFARSISAGTTLTKQGIRRRDVVAITCSHPRLTMSAFVAAISIGAHPVVVAGRSAFESTVTSADRLQKVADAFGQPVWLVVDPGKQHQFNTIDDRLQVIEHPGLDHQATAFASNPEVDEDDTCFYQLTSGSTGTPKPVVVTHRNLLGNLHAAYIEAERRPGQNFLSWLPLHHDMGLVGMTLNALINDGNLALMAPFDFMSDPLGWLRSIDELQIHFTASPSFCFELILDRLKNAPDKFQPDLSSLRTHYWGAEPVNFSLLSKTYKALAPYGLAASTLRPSYGLAEATIAVSISTFGEPTWGVELGQTQFSIGQLIDVVRRVGIDDEKIPNHVVTTAGVAFPGTETRIVDESGDAIEDENVCGEVAVTSIGVAPGYLRPDGTVERWENNVLRTGDLGFIHDGELFIVDRLKNIVIRNGINYPVVPLEHQIAHAAGVGESRVAVVDSDITTGNGQLTAIVEHPKDADKQQFTQQLERQLDHIEPTIDELVIVAWGNIPVTTSGKKRHIELRNRLLAGDLKIVSRSTLTPEATIDLRNDDPLPATPGDNLRQSILETVTDMARARTRSSEVTESTNFKRDLGFDSITMLELAVAVEQAAEITIPEDALNAAETVQDLINLARERTTANAPETVGIAQKMANELDSFPQLMNDIDGQNQRELTIGNETVFDFASLNYLGFDFHQTIIDSIPPMIEAWGVHPSWSRAVASPLPYRQLEQGLAELVGAPDALVFPTLTLQHIGLLPILAANGTLLVGNESHHSVTEAAELCSARGIKVVRVNHRSSDDVEQQLNACGPGPKVIAVNGVFSTSGSYANLPELVEIAQRHNAQLYVDDAHGFGIVGENPDDDQPWGYRGNGIVAHFGLPYDNIVYAGGLSKAYSTMAAFVTVRTKEERLAYSLASTSVFSGPIPVASLASGIAGLEVNQNEGDDIRRDVLTKTRRLIDGARDLGFVVDNPTEFPIVTVIIGDMNLVKQACDILWEYKILITPSVFPAAPLQRGGLRFTLTVTNTDTQVDLVLKALQDIRGRLDIRDIPLESVSDAIFSS